MDTHVNDQTIDDEDINRLDEGSDDEDRASNWESSRDEVDISMEENSPDGPEEVCPVCENLSTPYGVTEIRMSKLIVRAEDGCLACSTLLKICKHFTQCEVDIWDSIYLRDHHSRVWMRYALGLLLHDLNMIVGLSAARTRYAVYKEKIFKCLQPTSCHWAG